MLLILAEAAADASNLLPAISAIGSLGFAVWYAYYTTTVAIPKLLDAHAAERLAMQTRFDKALADERAEFAGVIHGLLAEMKEQRLQFAARTPCQG